MYNYYSKKRFIFSILLILFLLIGIGYAYLTSNLSIAGNTNVSTNTWNIHFENLNVTEGSVTASTPATINGNTTSISFVVDLNRPKDFYEFTVDVKNDGTLPGEVSISTLSGLDTTSSKIIDYSINYTNGNPVNVGDILNAGAKKTIKVRVFYKDEINPEDFPDTDLTISLTYTLQYVQSERDALPTINEIITDLASTDSLITKYEGQVTDQVGETVTASNVYFDKDPDKRNIIFAGFCWQVIRTTETGGIKVIYNGFPDSGKCLYGRSSVKGIVGSDGMYTSMPNTEYLFGNSFTYSFNTNSFTLTDTITASWNSSTYESLIGKYTCKSSYDNCDTIYYMNAYDYGTMTYMTSYEISGTNYASIGKSAFNSGSFSPYNVGYMFNKTYDTDNAYLYSNVYYGNSVNYNNGVYTLVNTSTSRDSSHRYTCNSTNELATCSSVLFYASNGRIIYLENGEKIEDALENMLYSDDVNRYNSSIKGIIDAWYKQNLIDYAYFIENTVFCNSRDIDNLGFWNPNGTSLTGYLKFKNYNISSDLSCRDITNQFAIDNNKAKLTYPVGLLEVEEASNLNNSSLLKTGAIWSTMSPAYNTNSRLGIDVISSNGTIEDNYLEYSQGIRPVLSLSSNVEVSAGSGSEADPWVVAGR